MSIERKWDERNAIQFRMNHLERESQAIRMETERLLDRLRELDRMEAQASYQYASLQTPTATMNYSSPSYQPNSKKEETIVEKVDKEPTNTELEPKTQNQDFLNESSHTNDSDTVTEIGTETVTETAPSIQEEPLGYQISITADTEELEQDEKDSEQDTDEEASNISKKKNRVTLKQKQEMILTQLRTKKRLTTKQIRKMAIKHNYAFSNLNNVMSDLVKDTPQIVRIGRGVFEWDATKGKEME